LGQDVRSSIVRFGDYPHSYLALELADRLNLGLSVGRQGVSVTQDNDALVDLVADTVGILGRVVDARTLRAGKSVVVSWLKPPVEVLPYLLYKVAGLVEVDVYGWLWSLDSPEHLPRWVTGKVGQ
jgi:hypothetical protein